MKGKTRLFFFFFAAACLNIVSFSNQALAQEDEDVALTSGAGCLDPQPKPNDYAPNRATDFLSWNMIGDFRRSLLLSFFRIGEPRVGYDNLIETEDGRVATFLAVTNSLILTTIYPERENPFSSIELIRGVKEVRTDRLILFLDVDRVKTLLNGVKYSIALAGSKTERGDLNFVDHTTASAGLHCGYDINWYTNPRKTPHIHWNMRFADGQADVHLDGYTPWIGGVIPNPTHLTYPNSDVRYWLDKYTGKYGDPGFNIKKRQAILAQASVQ